MRAQSISNVQQQQKTGSLRRAFVHAYLTGRGWIATRRGMLSGCHRIQRPVLLPEAFTLEVLVKPYYAVSSAANALPLLKRFGCEVTLVSPARTHCCRPFSQIRPVWPSPHVLPTHRGSIFAAGSTAGKAQAKAPLRVCTTMFPAPAYRPRHAIPRKYPKQPLVLG